MSQQVKKLILAGAVLGASYILYNHLSGKKDVLTLQSTRKIAQEIKHQILIVTINFAEGIRDNVRKTRIEDKEKSEQLIDYFRTKMAEIYTQKENLILGKYSISTEKYKASLEKYKHDPKIKAVVAEIMEMMEKSVNGVIPNLTIDKRAKNTFKKSDILKIYEQMSKMILLALISKLQKEKQQNPQFDSQYNGHFSKAIRQLNIYDRKIEFFKAKGFSEQWGCPNQTFFKLSEAYKQEDPKFKQQMIRLQQIYQKVVDIVTQDAFSISIERLNDYYIQKQEKKEENIVRILSRSAEHKEQAETYISLNKSTKSEPDMKEDENEAEPVVQAVANEIPTSQHHLAKSKSAEEAPVEQLVEKKQQPKVEDVPNDAKQLQKQIDQVQQQNHEHHQPEQKQQHHEEQPKQEQSNISLDSEPIKNPQEGENEAENRAE